MGYSLNIMWRTAVREAQSQTRTLWILSLLVLTLSAGVVIYVHLSPARSVQPRALLVPAVLVLFGLSIARGLLCRRDAEALDRRLPGSMAALFGGKLLFLGMTLSVALGLGFLLAWIVGLCVPQNQLRMLHLGWKQYALYGCLCAGVACVWTLFAGAWMRSQRLALVGCIGLIAALAAPLAWAYSSVPGYLWNAEDRMVLLGFGVLTPLISSWAVWRWRMKSLDRGPGWIGLTCVVLCTLPFGGYVGSRVMNWWTVDFEQENTEVINAYASQDGTKLYVTLMRSPLEEENFRAMWGPEGWNQVPTSAGVIDLVSGETSIVAHSAMWTELCDRRNRGSFRYRPSSPTGARDFILLWSNREGREHSIVSTDRSAVLGAASDDELFDSLRNARLAQAHAVAPYRLADGRKGWVFENCWYEEPRVGWELGGAWPEPAVGPDPRFQKLRFNHFPRDPVQAKPYEAWLFEPNSRTFFDGPQHSKLWLAGASQAFWLARDSVRERGSIQLTPWQLYDAAKGRLFSPKGLKTGEEPLLPLHDGGFLIGRRESEGFEASQESFRIIKPGGEESTPLLVVSVAQWTWQRLRNEGGSHPPCYTPSGDRVFGLDTSSGYVWARIRSEAGVLECTQPVAMEIGPFPQILWVSEESMLVLFAGRTIRRLSFGNDEALVVWRSAAPQRLIR